MVCRVCPTNPREEAPGLDPGAVHLLARGSERLADHTLELRLGDRQFTETDEIDDVHVSTVRFRREQVSDPGLYAFDLPTDLDDGDGRVVLADLGSQPGWSLSEETVSALVGPPSFENVRLTVPDSVPGDEAVDATVTVENVGESDGTFIAEFGPSTYSDSPEVYVDVPAHDTAEHVETFSTVSAGDGAFAVVLNWGDGRTEKTVEVT